MRLIIEGELDKTTGTYKLTKLYQSAPANYKVATIKAYDETEPQRKIKYVLLGVVAISQDGKTLLPINVGEGKFVWFMVVCVCVCVRGGGGEGGMCVCVRVGVGGGGG